MRLVRILFAVMLALGLLAPAQAGQKTSPIFPPDIDYPERLLTRAEEPALWSANGKARYDHRIRLSITGIHRLRVVIRIDVLPNGRGLGTVITSFHNRNNSFNDERGVFVVSKTKMKELRTAITGAQLWKWPRQGWRMDPNDICIDGEELLFERVDASGYRAAAANAQCTAPGAVLAVAQKMIDLSGVYRASMLLR